MAITEKEIVTDILKILQSHQEQIDALYKTVQALSELLKEINQALKPLQP